MLRLYAGEVISCGKDCMLKRPSQKLARQTSWLACLIYSVTDFACESYDIHARCSLFCIGLKTLRAANEICKLGGRAHALQ